MDDIDSGFDQIAELAAANSKTVAVLGARAMVLGKFHDAVVPYLATAQRVAIIRSFREGVENEMALMDDVALPANITWHCLNSPMRFSLRWGRSLRRKQPNSLRLAGPRR
jgi:hypothetical protein